jgi:hypothetical protein
MHAHIFWENLVWLCFKLKQICSYLFFQNRSLEEDEMKCVWVWEVKWWMSSIFVVVEHLLMHDIDDVVLVVFVLLLLLLLLFVFQWLFDLLLSFLLLVFKGSEKKNDLALELVMKWRWRWKRVIWCWKFFKKGWCCCGGGGGGETVVIVKMMMGDKDDVNWRWILI